MKLTTIAVPKKVAVAARLARGEHRVATQPVAGRAAPGELGAVADENTGDDQDRSHDPAIGAGERRGEPPVAVKVRAAGDDREQRAAEHDPDEHAAAPVQTQAAAGQPADHLGVAAGDPEAAVEQQAAGHHAQAEQRPGEIPGELVMEHGPDSHRIGGLGQAFIPPGSPPRIRCRQRSSFTMLPVARSNHHKHE
jgi:hypothetical protein